MTDDQWKLKLVVGAQVLNLVRVLWSRMEFLVRSEKEAESMKLFVPAALLNYVLRSYVLLVAILSILGIKLLVVLDMSALLKLVHCCMCILVRTD